MRSVLFCVIIFHASASSTSISRNLAWPFENRVGSLHPCLCLPYKCQSNQIKQIYCLHLQSFLGSAIEAALIAGIMQNHPLWGVSATGLLDAVSTDPNTYTHSLSSGCLTLQIVLHFIQSYFPKERNWFLDFLEGWRNETEGHTYLNIKVSICLKQAAWNSMYYFYTATACGPLA